MTLTASEVALLGASFGVISALAGSVVTWRATVSASREQWRRERARERGQRRAEIYQEMVLAMDREVALVKEHIRAGGGPRAAAGSEDTLWKAKAVIFGSDAITKAWGRWVSVMDEGWAMAPATVAPGQITDWQNRLRARSISVYDIMRAEVGTDALPWPKWWTRARWRLTQTQNT